jgi:hypothetical protein
MSTVKFKRLPAHYAAWLMPLILSVMMSGIVSFIATLKHVGPVEGLVLRWLEAWEISWLIAFPTLLLVLPVVRRIVSVLVEPVPPTS